MIYEPKQTKANWKDANGRVHVEPKFSGNVVLKEIGFEERMDKLAEVQEMRDSGKSIKAVGIMVKLTSDLYLEVNLKRGDRLYKSVTDLTNDPYCDQILIEVASGLLEGFPEESPGN